MGAIDSLWSRLDAGEVIIMDGGTGTEIQRRGVPVSRTSWSAGPMLSQPETIREIHEDYIRAGAEIIITNTFSTGRNRLETAGLGDRTVELNKLGVKLAREARDNVPSPGPVVIAGSMSTLLPSRDPTTVPSYESALKVYREQSQILAEAGVDVIVAEMIIRTLDARAAVEAARETGLPVWVGYSVVSDNNEFYVGIHGKHANEGIKEAVKVVSVEGVTAIFIMHSRCEDTGPALRETRRATSLPIGAYAHAVEFATEEQTIDALKLGTVTPDGYLAYARDWVNAGAQVIGGCCGVNPDHIQLLKEKLHTRVPK